MLVALPAFWAVRKAFPETHLALLSNADAQNPHYVSAQSILPAEGLFDELLSYPTNFGSAASVTSFAKLLLDLRRRKFDAVLYMMTRNRLPKQIDRDLRFFRLAGVNRILGAEYLRSNSLGIEIPKPTPHIKSEAEYLLDCLADAGVRIDSDELTPDMSLTRMETEHAEKWLRDNIGPDDAGERFIAVAPGSKWESKIWPEDRFADVVERLISGHNVIPIIFGGAEDREKGDRLLERWKIGANAAGALCVRHSAALLQKCEVYLGNDTGTMHLAACVGTPCVAIFAAVDWIGRFIPFGENNRTFRRSVECEGCHTPLCFNDHKCLNLVEADEVYLACVEVLGEN